MWGGICYSRDVRCFTGWLNFYNVWNDFCSGEGSLSPPGAAGHRSRAPAKPAIRQWGWGSHTLQIGIHPGCVRFRHQVVEVADFGKDIWAGNGTVSSPGAAKSRRCLQGQLSPLAGSMSPSHSENQRVGFGFSHLAGRYQPRGACVLAPRLLEL